MTHPIRWLQLPNGNVFAARGTWISGHIRLAPTDPDEGFEAFLDRFGEAVGGSILTLTGGQHRQVAAEVWWFSGSIEALLDTEDETAVRELAFGSPAFCAALARQYGLDEAALAHAVAAGQDIHYGDEASVALASGLLLRCPAYPDPCSYVRLVVAGECALEVAYWVEDEWRDAPDEVMGAVLGAILRLTPSPPAVEVPPPPFDAAPLDDALAELQAGIPDDDGPFGQGYRHALESIAASLAARGNDPALIAAILQDASQAYENHADLVDPLA